MLVTFWHIFMVVFVEGSREGWLIRPGILDVPGRVLGSSEGL